MSAPSWMTANMFEMSCGCWRLFSWQWCSTLCQAGLHLGPLENDLWQTQQSPYIKVRPHVLQRVKLRDRHSVIQNVSNGPFNVWCVIVAFFMFSRTTTKKKQHVMQVTDKWRNNPQVHVARKLEFMRYMTMCQAYNSWRVPSSPR